MDHIEDFCSIQKRKQYLFVADRKFINNSSTIIDIMINHTCVSIFFHKMFKCLWKILTLSLNIFIIKGFWTIVLIFISSTFQSICPLTYFRCLLNSGTYMELRTTSFIESMGVTCYDSVNHNLVKVLIPVCVQQDT